MNLARSLSSRIAPALTFIGLLAVWELVARLRLVPAFLLPAPSDIIRAFGSIPASAWLQHIFATVEVALMGLVAATAISIPIAIALSRSRFLSQTLYPLLVVVRSLPIVAIAPIIIALVDQVPPELIELSRSLKASMRREMLDVRLPAAIPYIFASLKVASTLVVTGAVVAEFVAADQGIGYVVVVSTSSFKMAMAFAALVVLVLLSLILFYSIDLIQRWFFPWSLPKQS
jgi:NitT/TauT family transport system permease protein